MIRMSAVSACALVVLSACCASPEPRRPPDPTPDPLPDPGDPVQLRGAWIGVTAGTAILDLRIGGGPTVGASGQVRIWLEEAGSAEVGMDRAPDLESAFGGEHTDFPWSTDFSATVTYDAHWESVALRALIDVDGSSYTATTTIERPDYVNVIWEFFRDVQLIEFFQPEITGKIGFKQGSSETAAIFDVSEEGEKVHIETPEIDPPFRRVWLWRYESAPGGWPTPSQADAFHDESWAGGTLSATIEGADAFDHPELTEVDDDTDVWLYAMVEYIETIDGLDVRKYWKYKSRVAMRAKIGVARTILTTRKVNPTGIGPSAF